MWKKNINDHFYLFFLFAMFFPELKSINVWKNIFGSTPKKFGNIITTNHKNRAIIYWVYNTVMVLPSKKYVIDYNENSYRWVFCVVKTCRLLNFNIQFITLIIIILIDDVVNGCYWSLNYYPTTLFLIDNNYLHF